jgi:hypothetical protein
MQQLWQRHEREKNNMNNRFHVPLRLTIHRHIIAEQTVIGIAVGPSEMADTLLKMI